MSIDRTTESETRYQLALLRVTGLGPRQYSRLLEHFGSAKAVFSNTGALQQIGLKKELIYHIKQPHWQEVDQDLAWLAQDNHHLITIKQPEYPYLLKHIYDPPPLLFVKGDLGTLQQPQLAMVGSRNPSPTGCDIAQQFAGMLTQAGLTITSGLALGIDAASHRGALRAAGKTIAVLGSGLRKVYPQRHQKLAAEVAQQGALISEFPLEYWAYPAHFPRRNRIISGLSLGTLVVEATLKSGSLITARLAVEQGREVFAVPSSVKSPLSKGCHALLQQGAKLVEKPEDVLDELNLTPQPNIFTMPDFCRAAFDQELDDPQRKLVECIGFETTSVDQIIKRSGFSVAQVNSMLLIIELHGYIKSAVGGYIRVK